MITLDSGEEISAAEHAAALVEGKAKTTYMGVTKVTSVRLPAHIAVQLQALAHKSGKTRNATVAMLLEVGLEEVRNRLSDEVCQELHEIEQELFRDEYDLNGDA